MLVTKQLPVAIDFNSMGKKKHTIDVNGYWQPFLKHTPILLFVFNSFVKASVVFPHKLFQNICNYGTFYILGISSKAEVVI